MAGLKMGEMYTMAKEALNRDELKIQSALAEEDYIEAQKMLVTLGDEIRPVYRAIFEASVAFASGNVQKVWKAITDGLRVDNRNYELYMMLGDYYVSKNLNQAYLCYENALFYCDDQEDYEQICLVLDNFRSQGICVPKAAIVILSYNLLEMTKDCIESIRETTPDCAREIIIIDNASVDGSVEWLKNQKDIKLLCNNENRGFPAACNQGIGLAETDSDIFLLNNDTVMTDNALFWLRMGLYENEQVGSTGSVTNHLSNFQTIIEDGKSKEIYLDFAKKVNVPMKKPYLNKLYLVGFALLLKRKVLNQIGLLDEQFSPGNFEDNDICLRINLAGYSNVLCKNSFIIHWGSQSFGKAPQKFNNVMEVNQRKFFDKWSSIQLLPMDYWNIRLDLVSVLEEQCNVSDSAIMVVGTGCGGFLSCLRDKFPKAQLYGIEQHQYMAQIADKIAETVWVDLDKWKGDELADTFDIILVNDSLEQTQNSEAVLAELAKMLKKDGQLIVSFANSKHYSRIERQNDSRKLFDRGQMDKMLSGAKLTSGTWSYTQVGNRTPELERSIQKLQVQYPEVEKEELLAYQWITVVEKQRADIQFNEKMMVCIPTYGHPEAVEDVLSHCAETYKRYGLDVYYYDSSEDDKTRKVIEAYQAKGYDNLYYIFLDSNKLETPKYEHILMLEGIQKKYEYMWYLRDRCWCEEKTLKLMYKAMETPRDLIFLDVGHSDCRQELSECNEPNMFYHRCGDYATSMDTTIYNVQTILGDRFNLKEFRERHGDYRDAFAHFLIIFEQLAKKTNPNICLLAGKNVTIFHSHKTQSGWHKQRIKIWGKQWIQANEALPDCYTDKDDIIKRTASFPWILGDLNALIDLHNNGVLTPESFEEIKGFWERVSDIPLETLRQIAYGEYNIFHDPMQLKQGATETMNLLLQAYEAVADGRLIPEKIPMKEITVTVKREAVRYGIRDNVSLGMVELALENVKKLAEERPGDKKRMLMMLQLLIGMLVLTER